MNKAWLALVIIGLVGVGTVVGWDFILTATGNKSNFTFNIVPIDPTLYGNLENHLVTDPNYYLYQQEANPSSSTTDQTSTDTTTTTPTGTDTTTTDTTSTPTDTTVTP